MTNAPTRHYQVGAFACSHFREGTSLGVYSTRRAIDRELRGSSLSPTWPIGQGQGVVLGDAGSRAPTSSKPTVTKEHYGDESYERDEDDST